MKKKVIGYLLAVNDSGRFMTSNCYTVKSTLKEAKEYLRLHPRLAMWPLYQIKIRRGR